MIEVGLVSSLIVHLNIELMVTCSSESNHLTHEINLEWPVFHQVVDESDVTPAIANAKTRLSLILCPSANISQISTESAAFDKNVFWLFNERDKLMKSNWPSQPLSFLSNVLVATELPDGDFILHEHYAVKNICKKAYFGMWTQSDGLTLDSHLVERRKDLTGVNLVVTVKKFPKMLLIESESEISGLFGEVLTYIQKELNFRYFKVLIILAK